VGGLDVPISITCTQRRKQDWNLPFLNITSSPSSSLFAKSFWHVGATSTADHNQRIGRFEVESLP
jgi:hypothetical protein